MRGNVRSIIFQGPKEWRRWLKINHDQKTEVWLVLPKKSAGGDSYRVYYNEAVEEALCFGWIDSRIRRLDSTRSLVRFTPRKSKNWVSLQHRKSLGIGKEGEDDSSRVETSASRCGS